MIYTKNVPNIERILRSVMGIAMIAIGLLVIKGMIGYAVAGSGVIATLTGSFGFCPMCALAGRRINQAHIAKQSK
jgi:Protein of unknown function (DUF2892)